MPDWVKEQTYNGTNINMYFSQQKQQIRNIPLFIWTTINIIHMSKWIECMYIVGWQGALHTPCIILPLWPSYSPPILTLQLLISPHSHLTTAHIAPQSAHSCSHRPTVTSQLLTSPHIHLTAAHIASHSPHSCSQRLTITSQLLTSPHSYLTAADIASWSPYSCSHHLTVTSHLLTLPHPTPSHLTAADLLLSTLTNQSDSPHTSPHYFQT